MLDNVSLACSIIVRHWVKHFSHEHTCFSPSCAQNLHESYIEKTVVHQKPHRRFVFEQASVSVSELGSIAVLQVQLPRLARLHWNCDITVFKWSYHKNRELITQVFMEVSYQKLLIRWIVKWLQGLRRLQVSTRGLRRTCKAQKTEMWQQNSHTDKKLTNSRLTSHQHLSLIERPRLAAADRSLNQLQLLVAPAWSRDSSQTGCRLPLSSVLYSTRKTRSSSLIGSALALHRLERLTSHLLHFGPHQEMPGRREFGSRRSLRSSRHGQRLLREKTPAFLEVRCRAQKDLVNCKSTRASNSDTVITREQC